MNYTQTRNQTEIRAWPAKYESTSPLVNQISLWIISMYWDRIVKVRVTFWKMRIFPSNEWLINEEPDRTINDLLVQPCIKIINLIHNRNQLTFLEIRWEKWWRHLYRGYIARTRAIIRQRRFWWVYCYISEWLITSRKWRVTARTSVQGFICPFPFIWYFILQIRLWLEPYWNNLFLSTEAELLSCQHADSQNRIINKIRNQDA